MEELEITHRIGGEIPIRRLLIEQRPDATRVLIDNCTTQKFVIMELTMAETEQLYEYLKKALNK